MLTASEILCLEIDGVHQSLIMRKRKATVTFGHNSLLGQTATFGRLDLYWLNLLPRIRAHANPNPDRPYGCQPCI